MLYCDLLYSGVLHCTVLYTFYISTLEYCVLHCCREGASPAVKDGCRFRGSLTVNKVAGNFHITAGKYVVTFQLVFCTVTVYSSLLHVQELACHMGSHRVTCHPAEVTFLLLTQPIKAGTRFSDSGRMQS